MIVWECLQNLVGWLVVKFSKAIFKIEYEHCKIYVHNYNWGVSLGYYIIIPRMYSLNTLKHEYGHSLQSQKFGPLYLFIVGIPSVCRNIYGRLNKQWDKYYKGWPENDADHKGGVVR